MHYISTYQCRESRDILLDIQCITITIKSLYNLIGTFEIFNIQISQFPF